MSIARFEKVSMDRFVTDSVGLGLQTNAVKRFKTVISLPKRATKHSAGYDFVSPYNLCIAPGETVFLPTGIRCWMDPNWVLMLYPRSSMGFKGLRLANTTGVIDADYYEAKNEGHIMAKLVNDGPCEIRINAGDRFMQGVFVQYGLAEEEGVVDERKNGTGVEQEMKQ